MSNQLRTFLRDECPPTPRGQDRGTRYWRAVEIQSSTWFVVESCVKRGEDIQRWITTSIFEASCLIRRIEPTRSTRIFVSLRSPASSWDGTLFEEIDKAYELGTTRVHLYQLVNGLSFIDHSESTQAISTKSVELQLLYNRESVR
jgi:hypothetical protein